MPTYEYECAKCGDHLEVYQSFTDDPLKRHKGCKGKLSKVFGTPGIVLKGSGFYRTDHGSASKTAKTEATSDTGSSDTTKSSDSASSDKSSSDKSSSDKGSGGKGSGDKTSSNGKSSGSKGSGSKGSAKAGAGT